MKTNEDLVFSQRRLWLFGRLVPSLYLFMAVKFLVRGDWLIARDGSRLWTDFLAIWSAGIQTLHSGAASVYGVTALDAVQNSVVSNLTGHHLPFAYPPLFLLVAVPLSTMPYIAAFVLWQGMTIALYAGAMYLIIPRREAVVLALAFPVVFANAFAGQEGLLAAALLAGSLALLDRRPVVAGVILGLLTFRPQLGMVFPFILLLTGRWRTIASATATTLLVAGVSLWCFGIDAWRSFLVHAPEHAAATLLEGQAAGSWVMLQSVFALVRSIGGTVSLAWGCQMAVAALTVPALAWLWRQPVRPDLKAAALALGAAMITPYLYYYDLCILAVPAAYLIADGLKHGFARFERFAILAGAISTVSFVAGEFAPLGPFIMVVIATVIVVRLRSPAILPAAVRSGF
jgi:arabinofuranan 3-O-arabinosyltransferase